MVPKIKDLKVYILFIISILIVIAGIKTQVASQKIQLVSYGTLEKSFYVNARVFYNQYVIKAPTNGRLIKVAKAGQRVSKNDVIANIENSDTGIYVEKLKGINAEIDAIKKNSKVAFSPDIEKIDDMINQDLIKLQQAEDNHDIENADKYKRSIIDLLEKKNNIIKNTGLSGSELQGLINEKNKISELIKNDQSEVIATQPGLLKYLNKGDNVSVGDLIVGLIDNYQWYIDFKCKENLLKIGEQVSVKFNNYDFPVKFYVSNIVKEGLEYRITLVTTYYVKDFYNLSNTKVKIIQSHYEGLKVPKESITEKGGRIGVYILKGKPVFYPVRVMAVDGSSAIIENVDKNKEVKIFDEILINK